MIKSVVREFHWAPSVVGALYFDSIDYEGLEYWYDDVVQVHKEFKPKVQTTDNNS